MAHQLILFSTFFCAAGVIAAPTSTKVNQPSGTEFWTVPCGVPLEPTDQIYPDAKYAEQYSRQIGLALGYVNNWIESFSQHAYRMSFASWVQMDAAYRYDWLKGTTIPKTPGQRLDSSYYSNQQFADLLLFSSDIFQRLSVGLEQIDVEKLDVDFKIYFTDSVNRIKQVLCVLENVLVDKRMTAAPNPTRNIMPIELRNLQTESDRDVRTFRVLKEYINSLEFFQDGFAYFAAP